MGVAILGADSTVGTVSNLVATGASQSIVLTWSDVNGATSYSVERSSDGSTGWTEVATPTVASYTDSGL